MADTATKIPFAEGSAPSTPAASKVVVYAKADGLMYSKDDAGVETLMSGGAGGATPTVVGCQVRASAGQTISNNTFTALTFDTETSPMFDTTSLHSGTDFTASATGKWRCQCYLDFDQNANGIVIITPYLNGSEISTGLRTRYGNFAAANGPAPLLLTDLVLALTSGDVIRFYVYQSSGGNLTAGANILPMASFTFMGT